MRILLDTHAFLWFEAGASALPAGIRAIIEDAGNPAFLSLSSIWEMAIKNRLGKLPMRRPLQELILEETKKNEIALLPISTEHIFKLLEFPAQPRDPFDRLLAAQCLVEGLTLISADAAFDGFGVERLWR